MATNKNFKCPYCQKSFTREDLIRHLEKKHLSVLPEGFTPTRMAFHVVNKKPITYSSRCRICKQPTSWDEKKARYNILCDNPKCKEAYIAKMKADMGDKYGAYRPTDSAEGLEKMLAGRKISGRYKFKDGVVFAYTGSYEKKTLEFMDKVLEIKSEDLQIPGPVIEYDLNGTKHIYIPDMYYIPYNLIIEVKDGGDHPNTNKSYKGTRERQMAKEKYVIEHTKYNYLRLTDNDFSQLLAVFADLKMHLVMDDDSRVIHVNENMFAAIGGMMPMYNTNKDIVVVNYMKHNSFSGDSDPEIAVASDPELKELLTRNRIGNLIKTDESFLIDTDYDVYVVKDIREAVEHICKNYIGTHVDKDFLYKAVFEHPCYSEDQIKFEESAIPYTDIYYTQYKTIKEIGNTILGKGD